MKKSTISDDLICNIEVDSTKNKSYRNKFITSETLDSTDMDTNMMFRSISTPIIGTRVNTARKAPMIYTSAEMSPFKSLEREI